MDFKANYKVTECEAFEPWLTSLCTESVKPTGKEKYYACPNPDEIIVLAGYETYHGRVGDPESFRLIYPSAVQQVYIRADAGSILLTSDSDLTCIDSAGPSWAMSHLTTNDIVFDDVRGGIIYGNGEVDDKSDPAECPFEIEINSGKILKGGLSQGVTRSVALNGRWSSDELDKLF
jgi:hypothetical protein